MKREFLQNLKIGDQPLPKEIIDVIMEENGRDVENAKKPFADYEALKDQLKTARDGLKAFDGVDVSALQGQIKDLQEKLTGKDSEWQEKIAEVEFGSRLDKAVIAAKGRNAKAITALLDVEKLRTSKDQEADIKAALENLKKESGYLFEEQVPPPYAQGTGTGKPLDSANTNGQTLTSALREAFNKK